MSKKEASATGTAVAAAAQTAVGQVVDYGADVGAGFDQLGASDYIVPFLVVLQSNSPQVTDDNPKGARPGMVLNTVTNQLYDAREDGIKIYVADIGHEYIEWVPRDAGGGIVGRYAVTDDAVREIHLKKQVGKIVLANKNELVETYYLYAVVQAGDELFPAIIAATSTKITPSKKLFSMLKTVLVKTPSGNRVNPPLWAHRVLATTVGQENKKGKFFNWSFTYDGADAEAVRLLPTDPIYLVAKEFNTSIRKGIVKISDEAVTRASSADGGGNGDSEDPPF